VPPGFTITTDTCAEYYEAGSKLPKALMDEVKKNIVTLEKEPARSSATRQPAAVSVRSGAAVSMPGMMDTVLNLGLTTTSGRGARRGDRQRTLRLRRVPPPDQHVRRRRDGRRPPALRDAFDADQEEVQGRARHRRPAEGLSKELRGLQEGLQESTGKPFPQDPIKQLELAIEAVFKSWMTPARHQVPPINEITGLLGTAVNVQTMVFGNMGETRAPASPSPATRRPARTSSTASS
jgi:pyruvate,orthophosphate dikinase